MKLSRSDICRITAFIFFSLVTASACLGPEKNIDDALLVREAGNPVTSVINLPVQDNIRFGLGDIAIIGFFSPERLGKYIWGVGPVISFPTATDKVLGSGKWSAGPSIVLVAQRQRWLAAIIAFSICSFAGDSDQANVNRT